MYTYTRKEYVHICVEGQKRPPRHGGVGTGGALDLRARPWAPPGHAGEAFDPGLLGRGLRRALNGALNVRSYNIVYYNIVYYNIVFYNMM